MSLELNKSYLFRYRYNNDDWFIGKVTKFESDGTPWIESDNIKFSFNIQIWDVVELPEKKQVYLEEDVLKLMVIARKHLGGCFPAVNKHSATYQTCKEILKEFKNHRT